MVLPLFLRPYLGRKLIGSCGSGPASCNQVHHTAQQHEHTGRQPGFHRGVGHQPKAQDQGQDRNRHSAKQPELSFELTEFAVQNGQCGDTHNVNHQAHHRAHHRQENESATQGQRDGKKRVEQDCIGRGLEARMDDSKPGRQTAQPRHCVQHARRREHARGEVAADGKYRAQGEDGRAGRAHQDQRHVGQWGLAACDIRSY